MSRKVVDDLGEPASIETYEQRIGYHEPPRGDGWVPMVPVVVPTGAVGTGLVVVWWRHTPDDDGGEGEEDRARMGFATHREVSDDA